jgi:hypothetical protein
MPGLAATDTRPIVRARLSIIAVEETGSDGGIVHATVGRSVPRAIDSSPARSVRQGETYPIAAPVEAVTQASPNPTPQRPVQ